MAGVSVQHSRMFFRATSDGGRQRDCLLGYFYRAGAETDFHSGDARVMRGSRCCDWVAGASDLGTFANPRARSRAGTRAINLVRRGTGSAKNLVANGLFKGRFAAASTPCRTRGRSDRVPSAPDYSVGTCARHSSAANVGSTGRSAVAAENRAPTAEPRRVDAGGATAKTAA